MAMWTLYDGHWDMSDGSEVLQHVTGQVEWLTNILKLPCSCNLQVLQYNLAGKQYSAK